MKSRVEMTPSEEALARYHEQHLTYLDGPLYESRQTKGAIGTLVQVGRIALDFFLLLLSFCIIAAVTLVKSTLKWVRLHFTGTGRRELLDAVEDSPLYPPTPQDEEVQGVEAPHASFVRHTKI